MYEKAIAVLEAKLVAIRRTCATYSFSKCRQSDKEEYISRIDEIADAIAALKSIGAPAEQQATPQVTPLPIGDGGPDGFLNDNG